MNSRGSHFLMIMLLVFLAIAIIYSFNNVNSPTELRGDQFESSLIAGDIATVNVTQLPGENNYRAFKIAGVLRDGTRYISYLATEADYNYIQTIIRTINSDAVSGNDIQSTYVPAATYNILNIIFPIVLVAGVVVMLVFMTRGSNNANKLLASASPCWSARPWWFPRWLGRLPSWPGARGSARFQTT